MKNKHFKKKLGPESETIESIQSTLQPALSIPNDFQKTNNHGS